MREHYDERRFRYVQVAYCALMDTYSGTSAKRTHSCPEGPVRESGIPADLRSGIEDRTRG